MGAFLVSSVNRRKTTERTYLFSEESIVGEPLLLQGSLLLLSRSGSLSAVTIDRALVSEFFREPLLGSEQGGDMSEKCEGRLREGRAILEWL